MTNLILFINAFLSYLLVFAIIVVLVILACVLGVKWKKRSELIKPGGVEGPEMAETKE